MMLSYSSFIFPRPFSLWVYVHSWQERSHSCMDPPLCDQPVKEKKWCNTYDMNTCEKFYIYIYISHFMLNDSHFNPKEEQTRLCNNKEVVVALTHQWGSWLAVTTIISSLKKASCSELTALQSTKALTRFWCGLLPETCRRRDIFFSVPPTNLYRLWNRAGFFWFSTEKEKSCGVEACGMEDLNYGLI